ncbi:hypothetical protein SDC9_171375 [bioreactor metagenome]|uniref:Uncharacterized protein n=1 Tax=bioreactor metagenome TaxID=1076179 RepID=A0A645GD96_9ZZZZ
MQLADKVRVRPGLPDIFKAALPSGADAHVASVADYHGFQLKLL